MRYMLLRRSDRGHEEGKQPPASALAALQAYTDSMQEAGVLRASESFLPSAHGVRLKLGDAAQLMDGPFADPKEMIAGFAIIDVPGKEEALDWLRRWPAEDDGAEIELREGGCPGGCAEVRAEPGIVPVGKRYAVLLRSSRDLEDETPVAQARLDTLDAHNAREAKAGVLLAADGLRTTARGARVKMAAGKLSVVDGPFTEIKELIAGYWLIRVASLDDAIAWAKRNPYPCGPEVEVEIREVAEQAVAGTAAQGDPAFTPALREAEQRMRAQQLESGMQAQLTARAPAWR